MEALQTGIDCMLADASRGSATSSGFDSDLEHTPSTNLIMVSQNASALSPSAYRGMLTLLSGREVGRVVGLTDDLVLGRARECTLRIEDEDVSRRHARIRRLDDAPKYVLEDLGSRNGTYVNGVRVSVHELRDGERIQLGPSTLLRFSTTTEAEEQILRRLFEWTVRDPLTGVFNRKHFDERLEAESAYAWRHGTALALLMLDVDEFKQVNDRYGHPAGDTVLKSVAEAVSRTLRKEDVLARYGGDEFAVIVRGVANPGPTLLAERLRLLVQNERIAHGSSMLSVRISIGVATRKCVPSPMTPEALLGAADQRLYEAKQAGRNRVVGPATDALE